MITGNSNKQIMIFPTWEKLPMASWGPGIWDQAHVFSLEKKKTRTQTRAHTQTQTEHKPRWLPESCLKLASQASALERALALQ